MLSKDAKLWQETKDNNTDFYGRGIVDYTERWANLMEEKLSEGFALKDIAQSTSREANTDGITGFMYGCAVRILSDVWVNGEELRCWHNKKYQHNSEGNEANESGGVLNPAILTVGD